MEKPYRLHNKDEVIITASTWRKIIAIEWLVAAVLAGSSLLILHKIFTI